VPRGASGVKMVISDDHAGLESAIGSVLPGVAWQRCRTHYHRNLLTRVPKTTQPWVPAMIRAIFEQPDPDSVRVQHTHVVQALEAELPRGAEHLDQAREDILGDTPAACMPRPGQRWSPRRSVGAYSLRGTVGGEREV
jgi:putative transposase